MADSVGMLDQGRLQQWARPYALYHEPVNRCVADFVGEGAFLRGEIVAENCLRTELGEICRLHGLGLAPGTPIELLIRPDDIRHDDASPQTAKVLAKAFRGADFLYTLELPEGGRVLSLVPSHHDHALGEAIGIRLELDHVIAFPLEAGSAAR